MPSSLSGNWLRFVTVTLALTLVLAGIAAVAAEAIAVDATEAKSSAAFAAPTGLTVTLADPLNIALEWKDHATHERGYWVEYKMYRDEEFVILGAVPAHAPRFRHESLAPETRFIYRVRPFFGCVSRVATVKTGAATAGAAEDAEWVAPGREPGDAVTRRKSIRTPDTAASAAPADLTATLVRGTGIKLAWRDCAADEDGYIVEIKTGAETEYRVCALLEPDTISFGLAGLPPETEISVRVRAFFYGEPSNVGEKVTGAAGPAPTGS